MAYTRPCVGIPPHVPGGWHPPAARPYRIAPSLRTYRSASVAQPQLAEQSAHLKRRNDRQQPREQEHQAEKEAHRPKQECPIPERGCEVAPGRRYILARQATDDNHEPFGPHAHVDQDRDDKEQQWTATDSFEPQQLRDGDVAEHEHPEPQSVWPKCAVG